MEATSKNVAALNIPPTATLNPNTEIALSSIAQTEKKSKSGMYSRNCFIRLLVKNDGEY